MNIKSLFKSLFNSAENRIAAIVNSETPIGPAPLKPIHKLTTGGFVAGRDNGFKVMKLKDNVKIPKRSTELAAGLDVYATQTVSLKHGETYKMPLGFALEIPPGFVAFLLPRSGLGYQGINLKNTVGTVDADYRGEVFCPMFNNGSHQASFRQINKNTINIKQGDRIAQIVILPVVMCELNIVDELSPTVRGDGGFGHTGA